jgi:ERCC4-related helicase
VLKSSTFTHKGLADLARTASEICQDVGPWASDWYIQKVVQQVIEQSDPLREFFNTWKANEKAYLLEILDRISITPVSYDPSAIVAGTTPKVHALAECLETEKADVEANDEAYSGLVFVTRRDTVLALTEVLSHHPRTKDLFNIGCLLGVSENSRRRAFIDITRKLVGQLHEETLEDFKLGEKNLLISTAVAEEGIDIQACGSVIRWNVPANMVSWAQSRGRARRKRSTYTVMFEEGGVHSADIAKWEALEREMMDLYNSDQRSTITPDEDLMIPEAEDDDWVFRVESTG